MQKQKYNQNRDIIIPKTDADFMLGMFFGGVITAVTIFFTTEVNTFYHNASRLETPQPRIEQTITLQYSACRQMLGNHQEIDGSYELRRIICNDPTMYNLGIVDTSKALNSYKTIVDSLQ